jgi:glucosamine kinase
MILIADSGSTKTDWRWTAPNGQTGQHTTDGLNPYYENTAVIAQILKTQLRPVLGDAPVEAVYFYGAGCTGAEPNAIVEAAIRAVWPTVGTASVNSDMLGAARAACGNEPGVVCILGTGSNVGFYDGRNLAGEALSLGFWLGDEGSGGHLGKVLVQHYLHNQLPPDLHNAFRHEYPHLDRLTVLEHAYRQPFPNRFFATLAPFWSAHIDHPFAEETVRASFRAFVGLYVRRLPEATRHRVHCVGSVAAHFAPLLRQTFTEAGLTIGQLLTAPAEPLLTYHATNSV